MWCGHAVHVYSVHNAASCIVRSREGLLNSVTYYIHAHFLTKPVPMQRFVEGYVAAVTAACAIAVALNTLLQRAGSWQPRTKMVVQRFIPFPAVGECLSHGPNCWYTLCVCVCVMCVYVCVVCVYV